MPALIGSYVLLIAMLLCGGNDAFSNSRNATQTGSSTCSALKSNAQDSAHELDKWFRSQDEIKNFGSGDDLARAYGRTTYKWKARNKEAVSILLEHLPQTKREEFALDEKKLVASIEKEIDRCLESKDADGAEGRAGCAGNEFVRWRKHALMRMCEVERLTQAPGN